MHSAQRADADPRCVTTAGGQNAQRHRGRQQPAGAPHRGAYRLIISPAPLPERAASMRGIGARPPQKVEIAPPDPARRNIQPLDASIHD